MSVWALVEGGTVRELTSEDPTGRYHPAVPWIAGAPDDVAVRWTYVDGVFAAPVAPVPTAASAKAALDRMLVEKENLGVEFQASEQSAPSLFPSDSGAQGKFVSAFVMASAGLWVDGTPWITAAGTAVPMTKADVQALAGKVAGYIAACTAHYASLLPVVAETPTADISTGWPSNG